MESQFVDRLKTSATMLKGAVIALYASRKPEGAEVSQEIIPVPRMPHRASQGRRQAIYSNPPMTKRILRICRDNPGIHLKEIMSHLGLPKEKEASVRTTLWSLAKRGKLHRVGAGRYMAIQNRVAA